MRVIVITDPEFLPGEAEAVTALLDAGAWRVHVRKPVAHADDVSALLEAVPERYYSRISLHDCHDLALRYGLGGVHLNSRNPVPPSGFAGLVSRSCHSFEELGRYAGKCDYMFLSPVFDSISKRGYSSHFSLEDIKSKSGIVNDRVFALGGVSADNIGLLPDAGFGGAAVLGFLWEPYKHDRDVQNLVRRLRSILDVFKN